VRIFHGGDILMWHRRGRGGGQVEWREPSSVSTAAAPTWLVTTTTGSTLLPHTGRPHTASVRAPAGGRIVLRMILQSIRLQRDDAFVSTLNALIVGRNARHFADRSFKVRCRST